MEKELFAVCQILDSVDESKTQSSKTVAWLFFTHIQQHFTTFKSMMKPNWSHLVCIKQMHFVLGELFKPCLLPKISKQLGSNSIDKLWRQCSTTKFSKLTGGWSDSVETSKKNSAKASLKNKLKNMPVWYTDLSKLSDHTIKLEP